MFCVWMSCSYKQGWGDFNMSVPGGPASGPPWSLWSDSQTVSDQWNEVSCSVSDGAAGRCSEIRADQTGQQAEGRITTYSEIRADQTGRQVEGRITTCSDLLLHLFVSKPSGNHWREKWTQSGGSRKTRKSQQTEGDLRSSVSCC